MTCTQNAMGSTVEASVEGCLTYDHNKRGMFKDSCPPTFDNSYGCSVLRLALQYAFFTLFCYSC